MSRTNRDHAKKKHRPLMDDEVITQQLEDLLTPAITSQEHYYRSLGLRDRILNLPLMVAAVLTLLWRDVAGVNELTRMLAREGFLWCRPRQVSQQALSQRFLTFPATLFEGVFKQLLPHLREKWAQRARRPLPESVEFAQSRFSQIWIVDGSTLESLFRKLKSLEEVPKGKLGGKMATVIDLVNRLPIEIWFSAQEHQSDTSFECDVLALVKPHTLLLLDRGFYHFLFWQQLIERGTDFITRLKKGAAYEVQQVFSSSYALRDQQIQMGYGTDKQPYITLRLIEIWEGKRWNSYLTSVLDPEILPPYVVANLYDKRWRIEDAFNTVKRLLGLSYLWTGSVNGIKLQIWSTWLFYAILVDLADAIADELTLPFDRISLEMVYRGLYHFSVARHKGLASDPVHYFAAPENQDLGVVKSLRKRKVKLIVAAYPIRQRGTKGFFFDPSQQTPLTAGVSP
jgi:hypothetical protein